MFTLRCTQKLLKKLRIDGPLESGIPSTVLGDWYANIIYTRQGHFILALSEKSFLPVVLSARDLDNLVPRFRNQVVEVLSALDIDDFSTKRENVQMSPFYFGRTKSRVVLGSLNDFAYNFRYMLPFRESYSFLEWSMYLAETPCGPLKYNTPLKETQSLFKNAIVQNKNV